MEDLPPGFRFYPTEEELVSFYLPNKLEGSREDLNRVMDRIIPVLDIYDYNPWDLPQYAGDLSGEDPEQWFFFIPRQESEARGGRPRRLTSTGYWKATGSPAHVYSNNRSIGMKRTMVFYRGRAPNGRKTEWKMNEYKAKPALSSSSNASPPLLRHEYSLCRVYKKSKTLRAFDRRPLGVEIGEITAQPVNGNEDDDHRQATTSHHNQNPQILNSPETSSSEEHGIIAAQTSNNMPMSIDNAQPLWDWDQLDWYYLEDKN